jgi:hypothetical protein
MPSPVRQCRNFNCIAVSFKYIAVRRVLKPVRMRAPIAEPVHASRPAVSHRTA